MIEFKARVIEIIQETPTTKTLVFDTRGVDFEFFPGQYVMLQVPYKPTGELLKRAYSIASSPLQKDKLELTVKKTPNGKASVMLTEQTKVGDVFDIKGPFGKFFWTPQMSSKLVLIGAGSGIVPLMSILRYIRDSKLTEVKATLFFSNTHYEEIIYRRELQEMNELSNIKVVFTLTRSWPDSWEGYTGRITQEILIKEVESIKENLYYLCGPPAFVDDMNKILLDLGVEKDSIKKEKYD